MAAEMGEVANLIEVTSPTRMRIRYIAHSPLNPGRFYRRPLWYPVHTPVSRHSHGPAPQFFFVKQSCGNALGK
jgi:hypothetical protein